MVKKLIVAIIVTALGGFSSGAAIVIASQYLTDINKSSEAIAVETAFSDASLPTASEAATLVNQVENQVTFEQLSRCEQLDVIANQGDSVAKFIADSGYSLYEPDVTANCNWHKEQLNIAYRILHPPVVHIDPVVVYSEPVYEDQYFSPVVENSYPSNHPTWSGSVNSGVWNNCNGIQEYGESYSSACHRWQARQENNNDTDWGYTYD